MRWPACALNSTAIRKRATVIFSELSLEIVSLRLQVFGLFIKPEQNFAQAAQKGMAKDERRQDYFDDAGFVDGPIYKRMALPNNLVIDVGGYNMQAS